MSRRNIEFPEDFIWGVAAAGYQIEGAVREDGRGLSVWDMFCNQSGKIKGGESADVGPDHYHRWQEDVDLMAELGVDAYRLSIAWPRVKPDGIGKVNEKGIAFYDKLIDGLLEKGIDPWVTLFHWDYPYELFLKGGWLHPDSSNWFADYTRVVVGKLSDRVTHWMTLNEPQCFIHFGHQTGSNAPGLKLGFSEVLTVGHNVLLAHGKAVQVIRSVARKMPIVGAVPVGIVSVPEENTARDIEAARRATFAITAKNLWNNTWWADPMILGEYPADGLEIFGSAVPKISAKDLDVIRQPLDFYAMNIYSADVVEAVDKGWRKIEPHPGAARTAMDWAIVPESLYWGPKFLYERYGLPIVIAENGMANLDWVQEDGKVHDPQRINYLTRYLREYNRAIYEGVPSLGYFQWSILDNFEWAEGFSKRFGLVYVDYGTAQRIPKDSYFWYKDFIASKGRL